MFINLTPHTLNIHAIDGSVIDLPSSGLARVASQKEIIHVVDGVEIWAEVMGKVTGLPEPQDDVFFIVSRPVASAVVGRSDILVPGDLVRDEQGRPIGCRGLSRI